MKKIVVGSILWMLAAVLPMPAMAGVDIHVSIPLPPPVVFSAPPVAVVIPGTYVYALPDVPEDIFFYGGWWWRPWEGRWYRSRQYHSGWSSYHGVPAFHSRIPTGWRNDYRARHWKGHPWDYRNIPPGQLPHNWKTWKRNKHWEKENNWGVRGMKFQPSSRKDHRKHVSQRRPGSGGHSPHAQFHRGQPHRQVSPGPHQQPGQKDRQKDPHDRGGDKRQARR